MTGRFYSGKFGGVSTEKDGIYFYVDKQKIKVDHKTQIEFED